ncbi:hypothetical protein GL58_00675 [Comamonas testosteroni]|uniref:Uncharacterized protein n=1 Tax=Comamonas testosteroni TaxID=285 RepID=A0A0L7MVY7_COMTE|nr:hypothetical protein [Comamonas testosteroni]KOC25950.1 hypothetical protein GL58_00675 [Comamonas testosteroni]
MNQTHSDTRWPDGTPRSRGNAFDVLYRSRSAPAADEITASAGLADDGINLPAPAEAMAQPSPQPLTQPVLAQLGRVQMSCHSREANNAGRLARFVGGQITHTGFSKRIGCGQERAQCAGKD